MGRLVYGYWDCAHCNSTGIRGDIQDCPNCGSPRDINTKFYMKDNVQYVPGDLAESISRNPDWSCPYCDSLNPDDLQTCKECGSLRTESRENYFDLRRKEAQLRETNTIAEPAQTPTIDVAKADIPIRSSVKNLFHKSTTLAALKVAIGIVLTVALIFLGVFIFKTHTEKMTVTDFSWQRSISVEELVTYDESGWSLPSNARLKYTREEFKEYVKVLDHYETKTKTVPKQSIVGYEEYVVGYKDLGNGMFEEITGERPIYETSYDTETYQEPVYRQEPVYDTKYYYEIDRWTKSRSIDTSGDDKEPFWGEINLAAKERTGNRSEVYTVYLLDKDNNTHKHNISVSMWNNLSKNDIVEVEVSRWGAIVKINGMTDS